MMATAVTKITRVIGVAEMPRALHFYANVLGLQIERETPYWSDLTCGNGNLALQQSPAAREDRPVMVILTVADLELAIQAVEANGGALIRRVDNDHAPVLLAHVRDTERNIIQLAQPRPD
jgi:predicted enzyme related to lactoylglutathione lyase